MEMLKDAAKIDLVHIPYKGNAPADAAILAGEVQAVFGSMPALLQNTKANKVRPLAVGTAARSPALPDVPTVAEQGYPGFEAALWLGIMGPANMPKPIVDRLHKEIVAIVATPEFKASMDANGAEPIAQQVAGRVPRHAARPGGQVREDHESRSASSSTSNSTRENHGKRRSAPSQVRHRHRPAAFAACRGQRSALSGRPHFLRRPQLCRARARDGP